MALVPIVCPIFFRQKIEPDLNVSDDEFVEMFLQLGDSQEKWAACIQKAFSQYSNYPGQVARIYNMLAQSSATAIGDFMGFKEDMVPDTAPFMIVSPHHSKAKWGEAVEKLNKFFSFPLSPQKQNPPPGIPPVTQTPPGNNPFTSQGANNQGSQNNLPV